MIIPNTKKIHIINAPGKIFGNMNLSARFFPEHFTAEDRKIAFNLTREAIGRMYGFDGRKIYVADQKDQTGSFFEITNDYVNANPEGWTDIDQDILIMSDKVSNVAIGHPVADCPVVTVHDPAKKVVAIGHCSMAMIDKMLPVHEVLALREAYDSNVNDLLVHIGPHAQPESYIYETYPTKNTNAKLWENNIKENEKGGFNIDLEGAVRDQLTEIGISDENIIASPIDTITDQNYFSNYAEQHGNMEKAGRNFSGATFSVRR